MSLTSLSLRAQVPWLPIIPEFQFHKPEFYTKATSVSWPCLPVDTRAVLWHFSRTEGHQAGEALPAPAQSLEIGHSPALSSTWG